MILFFMTGDNRKIQILNNNGFSLLEIIISVSVFVVVIMLATSIFQSVVEGQRQAISAQHTQESIRYVMEVISKDMRQAVRSDAACHAGGNRIFNQDNSAELWFENKHGECIRFYLDGTSLMKDRDGVAASTTPDEIEVSDLEFIVKSNAVGVSPANRIQQIVTMKMKVEARSVKVSNKTPFYIQTTVSSRFYE